MTFLSNLNWRFAVKSFDPTKKVTKEDLKKIKESIRMAPTSFGLQPFEVKTVTDQKTQEALLPHSWNQPQVTTCSHLLVFTARTDIGNLIEEYFVNASGGDKEARKNLQGYEDMMRGYFADKDKDFLNTWAQKQTYIALGFAMASCAELQVDSCPMEGIIHDKYDEILNIKSPRKTTVVLPLGYREEEPTRKKIRKSEESLFR